MSASALRDRPVQEGGADHGREAERQGLRARLAMIRRSVARVVQAT